MIKKLFRKTIIKFIIVGIINTIIGWIFMFTTEMILNIIKASNEITFWASSAMNILIGDISSYILNKYFTFQNNKNIKEDIWKFILNVIICYIIAYGILNTIFISIFNHYINYKLNLQIFSLLSGSILFTIINYFGQKFWVFT